MNKAKEPVMCDECNVEMNIILRDDPFEATDTTTRSSTLARTTSPDESLYQGYDEDSEVADLQEWVEYVCPTCSRKKGIRVK